VFECVHANDRAAARNKLVRANNPEAHPVERPATSSGLTSEPARRALYERNAIDVNSAPRRFTAYCSQPGAS